MIPPHVFLVPAAYALLVCRGVAVGNPGVRNCARLVSKPQVRLPYGAKFLMSRGDYVT